MLNRPSSVNSDALDQIPQQPVKDELAVPATMEEIKKAILQTNSGGAPGKNSIPTEIYKAAGPNALEAFHDVLQSIWAEEEMPGDCGNYRGISLLSIAIAGKIFSRVILNRLLAVYERNLPETQCGFRPGRSTVDMIFAKLQLHVKCIEQNMPLYSVFIDLIKAFDTVSREALWTVLERTGCPPKFVNMIKLFHVGMTGQVLSSGNVTETQAHAVRDLEKGVYIRYRLDGSLFDLRRLTAKTKSHQDLIWEALFADDCALVAHTEPGLQLMLDRLSEASKLFGLTISLGKTEVLLQPAPNTNPPAPSISIDDTQLANVDQFKYLGSTISSDGTQDREIDARISKASQVLGRLRNRVLSQHNIRLSTKLRIYNAVVLPSLLYRCEFWTLYRRHIKKLEKFHKRTLRSILGIRWQDRVTNLEVLDQTRSTSVESILLKAQLR